MSFEEDEPFVERHRAPAAEVGWVLLFLDGLLLGSSSLYWIARGRFFDRGFYQAIGASSWPSFSDFLSPQIEGAISAAVRLAGFLGLMASVFILAMATTSYRRAERWSWYMAWTLPVLAVLDFGLTAGYRAVTFFTLLWELSLAGLALTSLALSYRHFFPELRSAPAT
jgi:hypothetical protein